MHGIAHGTDRRLAACFFAIRPDLLRFARTRAGDGAEAEDIVQDLWLRLTRSAPTDIANPRAYLFQMVGNIALDRRRQALRRRQRERCWHDLTTGFARPGEERGEEGSCAETLAIAREDDAALGHAMAALPEGARRVVRMHKIEGRSHSEIAAALGISRSGVEKHMATAMRHLRTHLSAAA